MLPKLLRSTIGIAVLALASGIACAQADAGKPGDYRLGPGDSIKVQVYQNPDLSMEVRVSESGVVNYPLLGNLELGGKTVTEAERTIARALRDKDILKAPQVSINVAQVRGNQVAVLGQVQKPGRFPLETTTARVSEILAAAGGVTKDGDDRVVVTGTRSGKPYRKEVDVQQLFAGNTADDVVVQPGDTLFVAKAPTFFLSGEAKQPGSYRFERGMTVQQAIAAGGGVTQRGSINRLRITRKRADGHEVTIDPHLNDMVQAGDVITIKESIF
jgi:polysaccharide export outer membrane protein